MVQPRKEKNLVFGKGLSKVGDLKPYVLATCLARNHKLVTEQTLMNCGGELYEMRRKHLAEFKVSDTSQPLALRLQLAQQLSHAEQSWKSRMMDILKKGEGTENADLLHTHMHPF